MPSLNHDSDLSNGWDALASEFIFNRSSLIGRKTISNWSKFMKTGHSILDVGCGFGGPYTQCLIDQKIELYGIDASKSLLEEHQRRFPSVVTKCEAAELSSFFEQKFDGILSAGLIFLLSQEAQVTVLQKMALRLNEGGRLLFTSPYQICDWDDLLTGRKSRSLGRDVYESILHQQGLILINEYTDEGESHYFDFKKNG